LPEGAVVMPVRHDQAEKRYKDEIAILRKMLAEAEARIEELENRRCDRRCLRRAVKP